MLIKPLTVHRMDFVLACEITSDYGSLSCPFSERELVILIEGAVPAPQERFNDGLNFFLHFGHPPIVTWDTHTSNLKVDFLGVTAFLMYKRFGLYSFTVYVEFLPRWWSCNDWEQPFPQDMLLGKRMSTTEYTLCRTWHDVLSYFYELEIRKQSKDAKGPRHTHTEPITASPKAHPSNHPTSHQSTTLTMTRVAWCIL